MRDGWLSGPLQVFLFVLAFGLGRTILKASTRAQSRVQEGRHVLDYNVAVRVMCLALVVGIIALDAPLVWILLNYPMFATSNLQLVVGTIAFTLIFEGVVILIIYSILSNRISFDDNGLYQKYKYGRETTFSWSAITHFTTAGKLRIFGRNLGSVSISSYRNGAEELSAQLSAHDIPHR